MRSCSSTMMHNTKIKKTQWNWFNLIDLNYNGSCCPPTSCPRIVWKNVPTSALSLYWLLGFDKFLPPLITIVVLPYGIDPWKCTPPWRDRPLRECLKFSFFFSKYRNIDLRWRMSGNDFFYETFSTMWTFKILNERIFLIPIFLTTKSYRYMSNVYLTFMTIIIRFSCSHLSDRNYFFLTTGIFDIKTKFL
jgi:hypothetical protein